MTLPTLLPGLALSTTVLLAVVRGAWPELSNLAVAAPAWLAGVLLWRRANPRTRTQTLVLAGVGLGAMAWGLLRGGRVDVTLALGGNAQLIAMLAAVTFLRLVARPERDAAHAPPRGRRALWNTLLGVHLFGSVINLSAVFIMADRLHAGAGLSARQVSVLTRGFSTAAFWSPFFAAMAAALTYAPGAVFSHLMSMGLPLALLALLVTALERRRAADADFTGYPMRYGTLWLPISLAALVLTLHSLFPAWPVLAIICLLAPSIAVVYTLASTRYGVARLGEHLRHGLPVMANELLLFLAAGVMAGGVGTVFGTFGGWLPFERFGGPEAAITLLFMYSVSMAGVHPVIGIAVLGTLLAPLAPDPDLLAMTFLCAWATSVGTSPFSGMNLALQGRYGVRPLDFLRWNGGYSLLMVASSCAMLMAYARFAGAN